MKKLLALLAAPILGVGIYAGVSYASIPDASNVAHGCYDKTTGALRIIDDSSQSCSSPENSISFDSGPNIIRIQATVDGQFVSPAGSYWVNQGWTGYWSIDTETCPSGYATDTAGILSATQTIGNQAPTALGLNGSTFAILGSGPSIIQEAQSWVANTFDSNGFVTSVDMIDPSGAPTDYSEPVVQAYTYFMTCIHE